MVCSKMNLNLGSAYTFLSQIFDYGNTDLEKRAIFFKRLLPLLEFGATARASTCPGSC